MIGYPLVATLLVFILATSVFAGDSEQFDNVPGLYIDRVTIWETNSEQHLPNKKGYEFEYHWMHTLSQIKSSSLSLYNFKVGKHQLLSYIASIQPSASSGKIKISIEGKNAGLNYLAFSIVITTSESDEVQLHSFLGQSSAYDTSTVNFNLQSIASFSSYTYYVYPMLQWITALSNATVSSTTTRFYFSLNYYYGDSVQLYRSSRYRNQSRVNVLLISKELNVVSVESYTGLSYGYLNFKYNLGVSKEDFGNALDRKCILGLKRIGFQINSWNTSALGSSVIFKQIDKEIAGIVHDDLYQFNLTTRCFGYYGDDSGYGLSIGIGIVFGLSISACIIAFAFYKYKKDGKKDTYELKEQKQMSEANYNAYVAPNKKMSQNQVQEDYQQSGDWKKKEKLKLTQK